MPDPSEEPAPHTKIADATDFDSSSLLLVPAPTIRIVNGAVKVAGPGGRFDDDISYTFLPPAIETRPQHRSNQPSASNLLATLAGKSPLSKIFSRRSSLGKKSAAVAPITPFISALASPSLAPSLTASPDPFSAHSKRAEEEKSHDGIQSLSPIRAPGRHRSTPSTAWIELPTMDVSPLRPKRKHARNLTIVEAFAQDDEDTRDQVQSTACIRDEPISPPSGLIHPLEQPHFSIDEEGDEDSIDELNFESIEAMFDDLQLPQSPRALTAYGSTMREIERLERQFNAAGVSLDHYNIDFDLNTDCLAFMADIDPSEADAEDIERERLRLEAIQRDLAIERQRVLELSRERNRLARLEQQTKDEWQQRINSAKQTVIEEFSAAVTSELTLYQRAEAHLQSFIQSQRAGLKVVVEDTKHNIQSVLASLSELSPWDSLAASFDAAALFAARRYFPVCEARPRVVQLRIDRLGAIGEKLETGYYGIRASIYDRLGGQVMQWKSTKRGAARTVAVTTLAAHHAGRSFDAMLRFDTKSDSLYLACPDPSNASLSLTLVVELIEHHPQAQTQSEGETQRTVGWCAAPIYSAARAIVVGSRALPMLRGPIDPRLRTYSSIASLISADIEAWLCNFHCTAFVHDRLCDEEYLHGVDLRAMPRLTETQPEPPPADEAEFVLRSPYEDGEVVQPRTKKLASSASAIASFVSQSMSHMDPAYAAIVDAIRTMEGSDDGAYSVQPSGVVHGWQHVDIGDAMDKLAQKDDAQLRAENRDLSVALIAKKRKGRLGRQRDLSSTVESGEQSVSLTRRARRDLRLSLARDYLADSFRAHDLDSLVFVRQLALLVFTLWLALTMNGVSEYLLAVNYVDSLFSSVWLECNSGYHCDMAYQATDGIVDTSTSLSVALSVVGLAVNAGLFAFATIIVRLVRARVYIPPLLDALILSYGLMSLLAWMAQILIASVLDAPNAWIVNSGIATLLCAALTLSLILVHCTMLLAYVLHCVRGGAVMDLERRLTQPQTFFAPRDHETSVSRLRAIIDEAIEHRGPNGERKTIRVSRFQRPSALPSISHIAILRPSATAGDSAASAELELDRSFLLDDSGSIIELDTAIESSAKAAAIELNKLQTFLRSQHKQNPQGFDVEDADAYLANLLGSSRLARSATVTGRQRKTAGSLWRRVASSRPAILTMRRR